MSHPSRTLLIIPVTHLTGLCGSQGRQPFWYGSAWPSMGSKTVMVLPAFHTVDVGCNISDTTCAQTVWRAASVNAGTNTLSYNTK